ncbi:TolC family protein [Aureispira]|nr:TolC family protein [Aureispira sp.]
MRILIFLICLLSLNTYAQEDSIWSLEKCIDYAVLNNLSVEQANLGVIQATLAKKQAIWAQAPSLNSNFNYGFNFGRSVDPTSYSFINQITNSSSISLNLNQPIFQGLSIRNTIKRSKVDLEASKKDVEQAKNDVALSVAQTYLSILLAQESKGVLVEQAKVTKIQYDQTQKLITAGVLADNSRYDLEAQMARDEENIVTAQNSVDLAYVNLKVLMNFDLAKEMEIIPIADLIVPKVLDLASLDEIYEEALNNQPNVAASYLRERSAELSVKIAKGALWPSVSVFGSVNTNFSSAARLFDVIPIQDTLSGFQTGTTTPVEVYDNNYSTVQGDVIPYFTQLGGNIYANIGLSLSIPIFNGFRTRIAIQQAELGIKSAKLATVQIETTLKSNIELSLTDVKAAEKRLEAASKTVTSTRLSVQNTRKRYDLGVVNSFELTSVQNTLIAVESNLLQAKYDYLFKLKILDYYRGNVIQIK